MISVNEFLAFATSLYGQATLWAFCIAAMAFFFAARARGRIDDAINGGDRRKPLGLFDLSRGDTVAALASRRLVAPERLWTYDEAYLERFAQTAMHARIAHGAPALQYYVRAVLRRLDLWFAAALGVFVVLADLAISDAIIATQPLWGRLALIGACMGLVYAAADIGEDLKLASILERAGASGEDAAALVDPGEAAAANMLTRVKLVTITLSGVGMALFIVLSVITALASVLLRPPSDPETERVPVRVGGD